MVSTEAVKERWDIPKPVGDLLVEALLAGEAHHKTWCIERALEGLGFDLSALRNEMKKEGHEWEPGKL